MTEKDRNYKRRCYHKTALSLFFILATVALSEVTVRGFWRIGYAVPFNDPGLILYSYYPELRTVDRLKPSRRDEYFDILLLGGSPLDLGWGTIPHELREQLALAGFQNVRIFNLAKPSHTSRDSMLKYAALDESRFELVVIYHGINESRANNAPPELFRQDYSHYSWYEVVNDLAHYHKKTSCALPYTLRHVGIRVRQILNKDRYVLKEAPRKEWEKYGSEIKSAMPFAKNLQDILQIAKTRNDKVILMTFATHIPSDYTDEGFTKKNLDYLTHRLPIKLWGAPENVRKAVTTHNDIVRRIANNGEILFVDQAKLMEKSYRIFNDACHFTSYGSSVFVRNLLKVVLPG